jgi:hypothetical protein
MQPSQLCILLILLVKAYACGIWVQNFRSDIIPVLILLDISCDQAISYSISHTINAVQRILLDQ